MKWKRDKRVNCFKKNSKFWFTVHQIVLLLSSKLFYLFSTRISSYVIIEGEKRRKIRRRRAHNKNLRNSFNRRVDAKFDFPQCFAPWNKRSEEWRAKRQTTASCAQNDKNASRNAFHNIYHHIPASSGCYWGEWRQLHNQNRDMRTSAKSTWQNWRQCILRCRNEAFLCIRQKASHACFHPSFVSHLLRL